MIESHVLTLLMESESTYSWDIICRYVIDVNIPIQRTITLHKYIYIYIYIYICMITSQLNLFIVHHLSMNLSFRIYICICQDFDVPPRRIPMYAVLLCNTCIGYKRLPDQLCISRDAVSSIGISFKPPYS